jgi:hypothetical protein
LLSTLNTSNLLLVSVSTIIVIIAIVVSSAISPSNDQAFSQIIVVGPVWSNDIWTCTSDADFLIHGALRGLDGAMLKIEIEDAGTQSLYSLNAGELESFSVGSQANNSMNITRTGTVTGFLTLQTTSSAIASCTQ